MKAITLFIAAMIFSTTALAQTSPLSYSFIEGSYGVGEIFDEDYSGFGLSGSAAITDSLFLKASYSDGATDDEYFNGTGFDEIEVNTYDVGIGFHAPIASTTDFVAAVSYISAEAEFGRISDEGDGYGLDVGVRFKPTDQLELNAFADYSDIDSEGETGYSASAYYFVAPSFSVGLGYSSADEVDQLAISARLHF